MQTRVPKGSFATSAKIHHFTFTDWNNLRPWTTYAKYVLIIVFYHHSAIKTLSWLINKPIWLRQLLNISLEATHSSLCFWVKFQADLSSLSAGEICLQLALTNIPCHDLWICTYQPSAKKNSKHKVLIQAEFLWSESTKVKIKGIDHQPH